MNIHFEPIELIGRIFYTEGSYEERTPFDTVFNITLISPNIAFLRAAKGIITHRAYTLIAQKLQKEYKVKTVQMERDGEIVSITLNRITNETS